MKKILAIGLTIMMSVVLTGCYSKACGCDAGKCPVYKDAVK